MSATMGISFQEMDVMRFVDGKRLACIPVIPRLRSLRRVQKSAEMV